MTFGSLHYDTQLLIDRFRTLAVGEVLTYEDIEKIIGQSVKPGTKGYSRVLKARQVCVRDHGLVIDSEPKVGVKRLTPSETIGAGQRSIVKANREAKRGIKTIVTVDYNALSNDDRIRHNTVASHLGVLQEITSNKSQAKLHGVMSTAHQKLSLGRTLEAFGITEAPKDKPENGSSGEATEKKKGAKA